jgi:hypothetical protein
LLASSSISLKKGWIKAIFLLALRKIGGTKPIEDGTPYGHRSSRRKFNMMFSFDGFKRKKRHFRKKFEVVGFFQRNHEKGCEWWRSIYRPQALVIEMRREKEERRAREKQEKKKPRRVLAGP